MDKRLICIDISNVVPGKGGTGGGISTYAINLVKNIDTILDNDKSLTVYCIKNSEFAGLSEMRNIIIKNVKVNNSNFFLRLFWLHIRLPLFCKRYKINLLHRIVPELPLIKVCRYIITLHDFMFDFYLQNPPLKKYLTGANLLKFRLFSKFTNIAVSISDGIIVPAETIKSELLNKFRFQNNKVFAIYEASEFPGYEMAKKKNGLH
ncbi:MAG: glycosyltransferase [Ginsengibacter sp.]